MTTPARTVLANMLIMTGLFGGGAYILMRLVSPTSEETFSRMSPPLQKQVMERRKAREQLEQSINRDLIRYNDENKGKSSM